jgi:hypothetical protein
MRSMLPVLGISIATLAPLALAGHADPGQTTEMKTSPAASGTSLSWPAGLPVYDHILIVVEENKGYGEIVGQDDAPYLNKLEAEGAGFTKMYGEEHNSLLIVTFDENDDLRKYTGLTNPGIDPSDPKGACEVALIDRELCVDLENRVLTIFAGAHIKPGEYTEGRGITHVNILRTIEAMYGLPKAGHQQPNAAGIGMSDDYLITDVFETRP